MDGASEDRAVLNSGEVLEQGQQVEGERMSGVIRVPISSIHTDGAERGLCVSHEHDEAIEWSEQRTGGDGARVALITGITGQDGSYLAEFLLSRGYQVHGIVRRSSPITTRCIDHMHKDRHEDDVCLQLHFGDVTDTVRLVQILSSVQPHEIYHLAAQSHVRVSFDLPEHTADVNALGTLRVLEAVRRCNMTDRVRVFNAATSELFGAIEDASIKQQNEDTPLNPQSPYGIAKAFSFSTVQCYRNSYNMFAVSGILFNHESPRRGPTFVTRKITRAAVRIKRGLQQCLNLGNLDAKRDWGHAREYVVAMWMMLQQEIPRDLVIGSGNTHSVREFVELAFEFAGCPIKWSGEGVDEVGILQEDDRIVVRIDPQYFRPREVPCLCSDASKAKEILRWEAKITFRNLVEEMVELDMKRLVLEEAHSE
eukprot:TRINITY_DN1271_c0_g2_i1.p1 TRINITY_DN1271_c0_g2~~TRINITY_DN1271_c0_g2_i1.p1  ORF type:complete len:424 (-),score=98.48 TRINITY_DN1271_c0_g2_i1:395-1666(-)